MAAITKSGLYYPNRLVLATFNALIEVMGENGLKAILNYAHLREFINHYPPDNLEQEIDFADFSAIQLAITEMYGDKGGQAFRKRAGRTTFSTCLRKQGALAGIEQRDFQQPAIIDQITHRTAGYGKNILPNQRPGNQHRGG